MQMSERIRIWIMVGAAVLFIAGAVRWRGAASQSAWAGENNPLPAAVSPEAGSTPVLVELFTSEGCSSCPPADSLLMRLGRTQPVHGANVIVLEEHVDYWDRLGWKDPFSSEAVTVRQGEYAGAFGGEQVYTPQMVVDGHAEFVGSSENEALRAIRAAGASPKPAVALSWTPDGQLSISIPALTNAAGGDATQVYLAVSENMLQSDVKRGENSGRALKHDGVARQLSVIGKMDSGAPGFSSKISVRTQPEWIRANLRAVVFVQEKRSCRVLAAAQVPFPS
jgi:hypothetical protein